MYVAVFEISKHPENADCIARNNQLLYYNSWFPHPRVFKHSENIQALRTCSATGGSLTAGLQEVENLMLKRLLTNGLIPAYGELTTALIDERDCRFPDPRTDGLPTVCSAP